jgi:hypothetical protein
MWVRKMSDAVRLGVIPFIRTQDPDACNYKEHEGGKAGKMCALLPQGFERLAIHTELVTLFSNKSIDLS